MAIAEAVKTAMSHHYFIIGGKVYRKKDGGAIGSDLTGELAQIVMLLWDEEFIKKLGSLGIDFDIYK